MRPEHFLSDTEWDQYKDGHPHAPRALAAIVGVWIVLATVVLAWALGVAFF